MNNKFFIIDRFENGFAVCENGKDIFVNIPLSKIKHNASEGDVLIKSGNGYVKDEEETARRRAKSAELLKKILGR